MTDAQARHGRPGDRPWLPSCLSQHGLEVDDVARLTYVLVEERVGDDVGLSLLPWPAADRRGRIRFRRLEERLELGLTTEELCRQLYAGWLQRAPRIGDVFAAEADTAALEELRDLEGPWTRPLGDLFPGAVYDVSAEARKVAKLAFYASVAPVLDAEEADAWRLTELADEVADPAPVVRVGEGAARGR